MEWISSLREAIAYMEEHLLEEIGADQIADVVHISSFYFQKGFRIMTGYSIGEYLRSRRLYLAGLEAIQRKEKIIDLAYKYGYDTPESFTRAFTRFHGLSPAQLREEPFRIRTFLPLTIEVNITGGNRMDYTVEKMNAMKLIGFEKRCSFETSFQELPAFWDEIRERYFTPAEVSGGEKDMIKQTVEDCGIGEYGICIDDEHAGECRYLIAGIYHGGDVPEGMTVADVPAYEWVKFRCIGPMPNAMQTVNTRIFKEWLPGNQEYEIAANICMEWYAAGDMNAEDYESALWVPVKKKA